MLRIKSKISTMKTSQLTGELLDNWVARALGYKSSTYVPESLCGTWYAGESCGGINDWNPSTNWAQGGPIIERERINLLEVAKWPAPEVPPDRWRWTASLESDTSYFGLANNRKEGPTPLIAAMRAFVASKFGDEVPDSMVAQGGR